VALTDPEEIVVFPETWGLEEARPFDPMPLREQYADDQVVLALIDHAELLNIKYAMARTTLENTDRIAKNYQERIAYLERELAAEDLTASPPVWRNMRSTRFTLPPPGSTMSDKGWDVAAEAAKIPNPPDDD
jgi:hypothetical protein